MNKNLKIRSIYARSLNHVIGDNGRLPWKIDGDLSRFRDLTYGGAVIMGYKTWESLPKKPLNNRYNIVVTREHLLEKPPADLPPTVFVGTVEEALELAKNWAVTQGEWCHVWVIGGASIYKAVESVIDEVYETVVLCNQVKGDTYYQHQGKRELISEERTVADVDGVPYDAIHRVFKILK